MNNMKTPARRARKIAALVAPTAAGVSSAGRKRHG
jgi:hypothetical protein